MRCILLLPSKEFYIAFTKLSLFIRSKNRNNIQRRCNQNPFVNPLSIVSTNLSWYVKICLVCSKISWKKKLFLNVNQVSFSDIIKSSECNCGMAAFVQCSWCQHILCFWCFYDKYHNNDCISNEKTSMLTVISCNILIKSIVPLFY